MSVEKDRSRSPGTEAARRDLTDRKSDVICRSVARSVKPTKAGSLGKASLAHLMVYCERHELTGSLWLHDDTSDSTILFVEGAPAKVRTSLPVPRLGELLLELGLIDRSAYAETLHFALRGGGLHGALLKACGKLDQDSLEAGLREQTALRLIKIFPAVKPSSRFALYRDVDLLAAWGGVELTPVDPWWVLWWGSRSCPPDDFVRSALDLLGTDPLILQRDTSWDRFGFDESEMGFLAWWGEHAVSVPGLLTYPRLDPQVIETLVYVLFLTHRLGFAETSPSNAGAEDEDEGEWSETVTEVLQRGHPGTVRIQDRDAIRASLVERTVETGPPSFIGDQEISIPITVEDPIEETAVEPVATAPASERAGRASMRMERAFQTLLDPVECGSEDELPPPRGPTNSELDLAGNLEAMRWSSQAVAALRNGEYERAEHFAAKALERSPGNALLKTEYAFAAFMTPARRRIGDVGDLLELLKDATNSDPALDRPYYVRGMIFEYLGLYEKAYSEFRASFARNAHNAEAAAKVKEYVQRHKRTGTLDGDGKPSAKNASPMSIPTRAGAILSRFWKKS
jgi:tetratricopeptide (TPR) repeat protein